MMVQRTICWYCRVTEVVGALFYGLRGYSTALGARLVSDLSQWLRQLCRIFDGLREKSLRRTREIITPMLTQGAVHCSICLSIVWFVCVLRGFSVLYSFIEPR